MSEAKPRIECRAQGRAAARLWLGNLALATLIGAGYLDGALPATSWRAWLFLPLALVSSLALVSLIPGLSLWLLARLVPGRGRGRALALVQAAVWTAFQLALFTDTRVYRLFRYHFNGMVWNVMTTPGSEDAVELGPRVWVLVALASAVLLAAEAWLFTRILARAAGTSGAPPRWPKVALGAVAFALLAEKTIYARADLARDRSVTALARLYPFYQRVTVKRIAERWFDVQLAERARIDVGAGLLLRYPLEEPRLDPAGPRPSILIVAVDSMRRDVLDPEHMPELSRFAARSRTFVSHLSGGNTTRFGLFSLLYGLHGTYWHAVYGEQAPPVLVRALQGAGYEIKVLAAASMNFPELRSTAWVTAEESIEDGFKGPKHARDAAVAERFDRWLAEREGARPYFAFLLLDSPHQTYSVAPDLAPFQPYEEDVDYLEMSGDVSPEQVQRVKNRFLNAVAHADRVVGRILAALERRGELERTLVVVTGDHGEEFHEHGFWGHTSNYAREQVAVAFVMAGPGIPPGVEARATCHVDLAPTLLEMLGADAAMRERWSNGANLLDPPPERPLVVSGWDDLALWREDAILRAPTESHAGFVEVYDSGWKPHPDEDRIARESAAALARVARECRRFLR